METKSWGKSKLSLFPKWAGKIALPQLPIRKLKVGGNSVFQHVFLGASTSARVSQSQFNGHDLITTDLSPPYREFLLRHKGARRLETLMPVLTSPEIADPEQAIPEVFTLVWDTLGELETYANKPDEVLAAWVNRFDFRTEDEAAGLPGLRVPQIGALHAISAHFSIGTEHDPATVVLPTGTGKTETMLATQIYRRLPKSLVIVPSDALRSQIARKFISLGVLPTEAKVVPIEIARPRVAVISTGIRSLADAKALVDGANVIVALPHSLEASTKDAIDYLTSQCSDLIVDEAHHVTASMWQSIRERFSQKRILQFTATPFRRDGKRVDGKIVFNYKLGDAQTAGYYRPINLRTVEEYGDEDQRDRAIANEALAVLRRDRGELGLDHLLMARARSKERAENVARIYQELAPDLNPVLVYSGSGRRLANKDALAKLLDRGAQGSRIVICVDMLGEGFDLPNLKVAALHDTHKSLAITLQFIGRFTRKGAEGKIGEASVIVNLADQDAEEKLADLYAEGADWDRIIKRLSEERIEQELRLQDVVFGLKRSGDLHKHLSLWNLRPALSTQIFRTTCSDWKPAEFVSVLPRDAEHWHSLSEEDNVLVAVVCRSEGVSWGNYQDVLDTIYDLLIVRWDKQNGALFVFASDYDALRSEKLAQAITDESTALVSGTPIFNILNNVELPLVKSLGSSRVGAISFTSYFGPNVTEGLASIEKAESELNNLACLGYEDGERVIWGGTQRKGKVWQQKSGSIAGWIGWTDATWAKVSSEEELETNIVRDFLRPEKMSQPHDSFPIAVQWGEQAQMRFHDKQSVFFDDVEVPFLEVDVLLGEVEAGGAISIRLVSSAAESVYRLTISTSLPGGYLHEHIAGPKVQFRRGSEPPVPFEEYLQKDPCIVRYADGTYSYNCYHIPVRLNAGVYDKEKLEAWDWTGIPLNKESMHKSGEKSTIQYRTFELLKDEFDLVFNDDGHGEAADLICLKELEDGTIRLCLVHCKGAHEGRVSQDIRNFYTVCGQAQKSITAKHAGLATLYHDLKRRQELWVREGATRFLKGDMKLLAYFKEKARRVKLDFEMILVQPGASIATITDDALRLLATTELYLFKTTQAKFRVVLSE
jgi:superfamily II DNA or RNA helicase